MSLARRVVVEGPDAGREFELPLRGGVVGRGDGSLVQLTDPTVSRQHGMIELRDGALCWIDDSGRARTLITGEPGDHRARRQLAALAQLGDRLRAEASAGRDAAARASCDAALTALGAHRAFVLSAPPSVPAGQPARGRVAPVAAAVAPGETTQLQAPAELVDRVVGA